jgi:hypothetical protein
MNWGNKLLLVFVVFGSGVEPGNSLYQSPVIVRTRTYN